MKTTIMAACGLTLGLLAPARAIEVSEQRIVTRDQVQRSVVVHDVTMSDRGDVSGIVVNRSANPMRDLRLAIRYAWLWTDETRPGHDDLSRAESYTVPGEIPPGGSVRFSFRPSRPLERRPDGDYMATAEPVEFLEIVEGGTAPGTTSGTGSGGIDVPAEPPVVPRTRPLEVPY
jgi:hypothetical protein